MQWPTLETAGIAEVGRHMMATLREVAACNAAAPTEKRLAEIKDAEESMLVTDEVEWMTRAKTALVRNIRGPIKYADRLVFGCRGNAMIC
jgi:hypothetical protein